MANRYWVGGTGSWDGTAGTKWALTSGGAGGQAIPTTADDVFFDSASGSVTVTIAVGNTNAKSINCNSGSGAFTGTLTGTAGITIAGSVTLSSAMTYTHTGALNISGTGTLTTFGKNFSTLSIISAGVTCTLGDALSTSTRSVTLTNGNLNLNNNTLTCGSFTVASNANTRSINFGTGNINVTGTGTVWSHGPTVTNFSVSGTPVVNVTNSTATSTTIVSTGLSEANSISYNFTAGTYALSFLSANGSSARDVDFTGYSGTWNTNPGNPSYIYGNLKLSTGMTVSGIGNLTFGATSGTKTITTNGRTFGPGITFNGVGGTFQLQDALTLGSSSDCTQTNGTLDLSGKTLTVRSYITASGSKNLTFNGGILVCTMGGGLNAVNNAAPTNYTTTAGIGTGKISLTSSTAKTFVGGGSTFNCTVSNDGSGALTITGSNTFASLANGVRPTTFSFIAGTTTTISNWNISGTSGNLVTVNSTTSATYTLSKLGGNVSSNYLNISFCNAIGGGGWYVGPNSVNGGNNSGLVFADAPTGVFGNFLVFFN